MAVRRIRNGNGLTFGSKELPDRHTVGPVNERRLKAAQGENKLMKLMKHIMIALVLCAIPAVAFGQDVVCDDCDHIVPYYKGNGGFVGMMTADAEKVTFVASCDNVTTTGTADVNADGLASMLFNDMNGLACDTDTGSMQVAGLEDGAWYWITDDMNSAVGSLVNKAVLDNDMTMPADPGSDDIVMTPGQGAYFLKQVSTGRVGILSTIMAEPPTPPATMCTAYEAADGSIRQTTTNCMLGDGSAWIRIQGPERRGGDRAVIPNGGTVERDFSGDVDVLVDLWTMGGIVSETGTAAGLGYADLGDALSVSAFSVALAGGAPNQDATGAGVSVATTDDVGTITITDGATSYCTADESHSATITIVATSDQTGLLPAVRALNAAATVHGVAELTINCPSAAANAGQELVPDNPFPTDK